jgi:hypothetical protein
MRPGEILALRCGDVEKGYADIRRRMLPRKIRHPEDHQLAALGRFRRCAFDRSWVEILPANGPADWPFPSERGTPLRKDNAGAGIFFRD